MMREATKQELDAIMSAFKSIALMKVWDTSDVPKRVHNWHEEVSQITIPGVADAYDFSLHAFGTESPSEMLSVAVHRVPQNRLDIPIDADGIRQLGDWCLECGYSLNRFRDGRKKGDGKEGGGKEGKHAGQTECAEISGTKIEYAFDETNFRLVAREFGASPNKLLLVWLNVSHDGPAGGNLGVEINDNTLQELAQWLLDCRFLLEWLRRKKDAEIEEAVRTLLQIRSRVHRKFQRD